MNIEPNNIYLGDCLELMKDIPDGSVDMILADLPYGTTQCKWDSVIPFDKLWNEYKRIIKKGRAIILFGSEPFSSYLRTSNIGWYKYDWYWKKGNSKIGHLNAKRRPLFNIETISVFGDSLEIYNPQGIVPFGKITKRGSNGEAFGKSGKENYQEFTNYPVHLLDFKKDKEKLHTTQKPVALFEYLIKTYTNEGDLVLDNVAGSGTTAIACINTNRNYILMEMGEKYYGIAKERIERHKSQIST